MKKKTLFLGLALSILVSQNILGTYNYLGKCTIHNTSGKEVQYWVFPFDTYFVEDGLLKKHQRIRYEENTISKGKVPARKEISNIKVGTVYCKRYAPFIKKPVCLKELCTMEAAIIVWKFDDKYYKAKIVRPRIIDLMGSRYQAEVYAWESKKKTKWTSIENAIPHKIGDLLTKGFSDKAFSKSGIQAHDTKKF